MDIFQDLKLANKARQQLGLQPVLQNAFYRLGMRTGHWKRLTPQRSPVEDRRVAEKLEEIAQSAPRPVLAVPKPEALRLTLGENLEVLLHEANELVRGQFRRFGGPPVPLDLSPHSPLQHWTEAQSQVKGDIKDVWDPARFGWVFVLARAYHITGREEYSLAFWENFQSFRVLNPYNLGANWASGQEVALRILALSFAWQFFHSSPHSTPERRLELVQSIYEHAARIPPTLIYAQSQRNNHLITEALGLYTAGWVLEGAPEAGHWFNHGQQTFFRALQDQIGEDGTYMQHSMNYHRLMLHAALWGHTLNRRAGSAYPKAVMEKLVLASRWLLAQIDPFSGKAPNLGANDGSQILPLATCTINDYRPVAQAVTLAFVSKSTQPEGCWNEASLWLGLLLSQDRETLLRVSSPAVLRLGDAESWATLRAATFTDRPSHADQLHVELWWQEENIARDAGTYRYNAPPPWDNSLAGTAVHNTVMIDGYDQMERAGRFLWLDWAQPNILSRGRWNYEKLIAEHDGYQFLNLVHRRSLSRLSSQHWLVEDLVEPIQPDKRAHDIRLHWLVPDWSFEIFYESVELHSARGNVRIGLSGFLANNRQMVLSEHLSIFRAGTCLYGSSAQNSILGWYSPTYAHREPALSIILSLKEIPPVRLLTAWSFTPRG